VNCEVEMLYVFLLALFLVEFLVIAGAIVLVILFSCPEVPLKGDGGMECILGDAFENTLKQ
jgi:hypothetical protein